jgi:hypothetical protein
MAGRSRTPVVAPRGGWARRAEPFQPGHTISLKHGLFSEQLREGDAEEIAAIRDQVGSLLPTPAAAFQPAVEILAERIWRLRRALAYLSTIEEDAVPRNFGERLSALESRIDRSLRDLGLTPTAAAELGVNLARLAAIGEDGPGFNWSALTREEQAQLDALIAKGRRSANGD